MRRWAGFAVLAALGLVGIVAGAAITAPGDVTCNSATATAQTPNHVIGVDGAPVSTVPGDTRTAVATACATEPAATTVTVTVGTTAPPPPPPPPPPATITMGETALLGTVDNYNGNLLIAQSATLSQPATLLSLSFNVVSATGNLRLGVYSDAGGRPGSLLATTDPFAAVAGWNTQPVTSQPNLAAGTYWLAYVPSSDQLAFRKGTSIGLSGVFQPLAFGPLPATFSATPSATQGNAHRSLYATLMPTGTPPPPPPPPPPGFNYFSGTFQCYGAQLSTSPCYSLGGS